jgi:hypothetical protein
MSIIKILSLASFGLGSLFLNSCGCCTGEEPVPPLRPIPPMQELPGVTEEVPVIVEK